MRRAREARQAQRTAALIHALIDSGHQLRVDLTPSVIRKEFSVPVHVFHWALEQLKHETRVVIQKNGLYRQSSRAHDYQADTAVIGPPAPLTLTLTYAHVTLGRNGSPKRRGSQWTAWQRTQRPPQEHP